MMPPDFIARLETVVGFQLSSYKEPQLVRRIEQFMQKKGLAKPQDFLAALQLTPALIRELRENITINTSQFFRDRSVFDALSQRVLPDVLSDGRPLRVWSAGASIGAEVYSIAILLKEMNPDLFNRHQLLATDIDSDILRTAQEAVYAADKLGNVPPGLTARYFSRHTTARDQAVYQLDASISARVRFRQHDLLRDAYPRPFDLVLCRNVLIYFRREAQKRVIQGLLSSLTRGGYLLLGSSEVIFDTQQKALERVGPSIYRLHDSGKLPLARVR